jgi:hypothetical protein
MPKENQPNRKQNPKNSLPARKSIDNNASRAAKPKICLHSTRNCGHPEITIAGRYPLLTAFFLRLPRFFLKPGFFYGALR